MAHGKTSLPASHPDELRRLAWTQDDRAVGGDFYPDGKGHNLVASSSYPISNSCASRVTRSAACLR
jgi:hypothetical protein